jgi:pimeloyl-ACP methyl ester carboxylesterase
MPILATAGYAVLAPDMRGYGDSDKPAGAAGYDGRALAAEFRALVHLLGFGAGQPLLIGAHDMGAPPALLWAADFPDEVRGLFYMGSLHQTSKIVRLAAGGSSFHVRQRCWTI